MNASIGPDGGGHDELAALCGDGLGDANPGCGSACDEVWDKYPKDENRATGASVGAPKGCCCFPKLHRTATEKLDCKAGIVEFDCKAECAQLKDGRDPSGCTWTKADCPR